MIKIIDYNSEEKINEPCVLMLGYFDGMHIGHRALMHAALAHAAKEYLKVVIMTFYDAKNGLQIYPFEERVRLFEKLGADFVLSAKFDDNFKNTSKEEFINKLFEKFNIKALVCGEDFTFGKNANGNIEDLKKSAFEHGATLKILPLVGAFEHKAAASLCKEYLQNGEIEKLNKVLGDRYFITGKVSTEGRKVGTTLGFPTANLHISPDKYPLKQGVYAVSADINGTTFKGIANYGKRPTFNDTQLVYEIYFDGQVGDLYGKEITVYIDGRIRDIKKFRKPENLIAQLKKDLEKIR